MRHPSWTAEFPLNADGIDALSSWLEEVQLEAGIEARNCMRVRLLTEEMLLRLRDRLGEDTFTRATCDVRLFRPRLRIEAAGEPFNPLAAVDPELGEWDSSLRSAIGLMPQYSYEAGKNVLRLALPHAGMNPVAKMAASILLGILFGFVGRALLPSGLRESAANALLSPSYEMWACLLNALSGPVIFLTVLTTVLNTKSIDRQGGSSLIVIARYFGLSLAVVAFALLGALPLLSLGLPDGFINADLALELMDHIPELIPANVIEPFIESNTSQLLFLAFVIGFVLVGLGNRVDAVKRLVREANVVGLKLAGLTSFLVAPLTGAFLCLEAWQGRVALLVGLWKPLLIALALSLVIVLLLVLLLSRAFHVSPTLLVRKLWSPFAAAVRTGSLDESFGEAQRSCTRLLGIDGGYVKVGLPQGLVLYMPISAVGTIVFTLFVAHESGVQGDPVWFATAILMAVVVFVATPPVPGANLLAYVVLFSALGIPEDALLDAMVFDIVFGIFAGAANQAMLQLEMLYQASRIGLVDSDVLRKPAASA